MDTVTVAYEWAYRSMTATYDGERSFTMLVDAGESHDEIVERAEERARRMVCQRGGFSPMLVTIRRLRIGR